MVTKHALYMREWINSDTPAALRAKAKSQEKNPAAFKAARKKWQEEHPEAVRAHHRVAERVRKAVRRGDLVKEPCQVCGAAEVHAHHHNGRDPAHELDVVWLCPLHHREAHGRKPFEPSTTPHGSGVVTLSCADCGAEWEWTVRPGRPRYCESCAHNRNLASWRATAWRRRHPEP